MRSEAELRQIRNDWKELGSSAFDAKYPDLAKTYTVMELAVYMEALGFVLEETDMLGLAIKEEH
jgi:hypothetical protein